MSGVKGRSGGARPGSGRKPKAAALSPHMNPLEFLRAVWMGEIDANSDQVKAACAALPFVMQKPGEGKKKDAKDAAKQAASDGVYSTPKAPTRDTRTLN